MEVVEEKLAEYRNALSTLKELQELEIILKEEVK
jgi:hypothetical protein